MAGRHTERGALYQTVRHLLEAKVEPDRIWWMRLYHPLLLQESLGDLVRAVLTTSHTPQRPVFLMLDELVYTERWDLWLKTFFDEQWPVRIAATSSATAALRERRLESGIGRWSEQHLTPYLFTEFLALVGRDRPVVVGDTLAGSLAMLEQGQRADPDLATWRRLFMLVGGFPELLTAARDRPDEDEPSRLLESQQVLRSDAVERAIYKDIPQSFGVDNPMMLERLLYVLAAQVTGLLSPSNICGDLGLSQPTFDRYLSYLEQAFLVFTLPNYSGRETTVQKRGRKLYFVDGAIRNAALQRGLAPLDNPTELGALLENLVAATVDHSPSTPASGCTTGVTAGTRSTWSSTTRITRWPSRSVPRPTTVELACARSWIGTPVSRVAASSSPLKPPSASPTQWRPGSAPFLSTCSSRSSEPRRRRRSR
ncbi:MAG: ATP-binding protein [Acidimicrobiales bacterium]